MVVVVGLTEGLLAVELKPDGLDDHEYVCPTVDAAPMVALPPLHIAVLLPALAVGIGFTVTVTELDLVQPVAVIVSVKV